MATRWKVPGTTDISVVAAWASSAGGAGGASVPTTGDTVYFQEDNAIITAGLTTLSPASGLAAVYIPPGFRGGTAEGTSLTISTTGNCEVGCEGARLSITAGAANIAKLVVATSKGARIALNGGTFTLIHALSGKLTISGSTAYTTLVAATTAVIDDYTGTASTLVTLSGSSMMRTERTSGTYIVDGQAKLNLRKLAAVSTELRLAGSGIVQANNSGTIALLNQTGATSLFTPAGGGTNVTVTAANRYAGVFVSRAGTVLATIGTDNNVGGPGVTDDPSATYTPPFSEFGGF